MPNEQIPPAAERELAYIDGSRRAWLTMLHHCLSALGYDHPEVGQSAWVAEREEVVTSLRRVCAEHGDNEWEPDLHLSDVIEKHLEPHLAGETEQSNPLK